jgi:hypothetical protein
MTQAKLVDFGGMLSEMRDTQRQLKEAVERCQNVTAYYQGDAERQRHALRVLKGELIRQHQAELYRVNSGRFVALRQLIYEHFRDTAFPAWDCDRYPDGVYYRDAFTKAQASPWGVHLGESTYRRRLNELADKRETNPRLLRWFRPGYYVLAKVEGSR